MVPRSFLDLYGYECATYCDRCRRFCRHYVLAPPNQATGDNTHTHTPFHPLSWTACHLNHDLILWLWHQRWHHRLTGSGPRSVGSRETLLMCTGTFSRGSSCDGTGNRMANTGSTFQCKQWCNQTIHRKSKTKTYYSHIPWHYHDVAPCLVLPMWWS